MILNGAETSIRYNRSYFWIDCKYYIKSWKYRIRLRPIRAKKKNVLYLAFDPHRGHPGLADRIKTIVILYNIAKLNDYEFRYFWETPFKLSRYLLPKGDYEISWDKLENSILDTKQLIEVNWREVSHLVPNKQYHCYIYSGNEMPRTFLNTGLKWTDLFHDLFRPSQLLQDAFDRLEITPRTYVSVHLRFVNALDHFENTFFDNRLETEEEKSILIEKCRKGILDIAEKHKGLDVYVFSDSARFLNSINDLPVHVLDSNNIGHAGLTGDADSTLKSFLDLYVMSQGNAVYRVRAKELYNCSEYAKLAAAISDIPFINKDV